MTNLRLCRLAAFLLAGTFAILLALPAEAQYALKPGFPASAQLGPAHAKGAVIWNHGKAAAVDLSKGPIDAYMAVLRDAGWDVFRLNRPMAEDNPWESPHEISRAIDDLRQLGYAKIVLAGQSFGAWNSVITATKRNDLDALVLTSPAAYGDRLMNPRGYGKNATVLYDLLEHVNPTRIMVFLFQDDSYAPGDRGPEIDAILSDRGIPHLVIDQPPDLSGHGAAHEHLFAGRYGPCIAAFIDPQEGSDVPVCSAAWGSRPTGEVPLPKQVRIEPPANTVPADIAALSGRWWGWYRNGREVELAVESITPEKATFIYGVGPGSDTKAAASALQREGVIADRAIVSDEPGRAIIVLKPASPDQLALRWQTPDGKAWLETVLTRLQ